MRRCISFGTAGITTTCIAVRGVKVNEVIVAATKAVGRASIVIMMAAGIDDNGGWPPGRKPPGHSRLGGYLTCAGRIVVDD
jgi:hypothetical protein